MDRKFWTIFLICCGLLMWAASGLLYETMTNPYYNVVINTVIAVFYFVTLIPVPSFLITMVIIGFTSKGK